MTHLETTHEVASVMPRHWQSPRDQFTGYHLEEVRDLLLQCKHQDAPCDYDRSPATTVLRLARAGSPSFQMLFSDGLGEPMTVSRHALRQLADRTLPSRGLGFLDAMCEVQTGGQVPLRDAGAELATVAWSLFSRQQKSPLMFRTVKRGTGRHVRAVLSQGYAVYDNLEFVEDVLSSLGRDADNFRAIGWDIGDDAMRLRLVGGEQGLKNWGERALDKPIPMVELWDSEIGKRAVYVKSGTYTLWCANGCGHWSDGAQWRWNHTGRTSQRIRDGVASAIHEAAAKASGIVEAYDMALDTTIDNAMAWFESQVADMMSESAQKAVGEAMLNEPTVHGSGRLLASVVDAVTWVAHEQTSIFEQERLERIGGQLLDQGLRQAAGGGHISTGVK